ncbi:MAG TPA: hypothetical protein VI238_01395 [Dokdonella sp.]
MRLGWQVRRRTGSHRTTKGTESPTMILFKGGQVQATQMSLVSKSQLTEVQ